MSQSEQYRTVAGEASEKFEEKRSVFIGQVKRVETEAEALEFIGKCRKKYYDARHNVYAYVISKGPSVRYSDDGEPQGTGGIPVLDVIKKNGVSDVCVVVTRYFGGILLGAGGLVRAYSNAAALAIKAAGTVTYERRLIYELNCPYSAYRKFVSEMPRAGVEVDSTEFGADVRIRFAVRERESENFLRIIAELSGGRDVPVPVGERFG